MRIMRAGIASRIALAAAAHRAAHQVLEEGLIFRDPLAFRILRVDGDGVRRRNIRRGAGSTLHRREDTFCGECSGRCD
jgi:O-methyltransferase involved in polyketide biosynthesis